METERDGVTGANLRERDSLESDDASHAGPQQPTRTGTLIAIVEDDATLASTFKQVLEEERGWETVIFGDGEVALHTLPAAQPDMILLDVSLPGLDGISLYRMLRARRETFATPILIVTASQDWELQRLGLKADALLRKPFEIDDLLVAVENLLREPPMQVAAQ